MSEFLPDHLDFGIEQPIATEISITDDVFIRQIFIPRAGSFVPQHSHVWDHTSLLAVGSVRIWEGDVLRGDFTAPVPIRIMAGVKHTFLSLVDGVVFFCIHNTMRTGIVEVLNEHELPHG